MKNTTNVLPRNNHRIQNMYTLQCTKTKAQLYFTQFTCAVTAIILPYQLHFRKRVPIALWRIFVEFSGKDEDTAQSLVRKLDALEQDVNLYGKEMTRLRKLVDDMLTGTYTYRTVTNFSLTPKIISTQTLLNLLFRFAQRIETPKASYCTYQTPVQK